ncbi:MAG: hypothetical protein KGJ78_14240 [Alphaproteobacteria bacterium]|nr:hypothetical protein [Alphaproteobacteria bacterium]
MTRRSHIAVVTLAALALAGCGIVFPSARERAARNNPNFQSGYTDGCASANQQGANYRKDAVRDDVLYKTDKAYRSGWGSGFYNCRNNVTRAPTTPGAGPIPDNSPGGQPY